MARVAKAKIVPPSEIKDDDVIDPGAQFQDVAAVSGDELSSDASEDEIEKAYQAKRFKIKVPMVLNIAGVQYSPGPVYEVDRGTMEMITEMADRKRRADLSVFTGKNHLVERLLDRTLKITEVETLDFRKI